MLAQGAARKHRDGAGREPTLVTRHYADFATTRRAVLIASIALMELVVLLFQPSLANAQQPPQDGCVPCLKSNMTALKNNTCCETGLACMSEPAEFFDGTIGTVAINSSLLA